MARRRESDRNRRLQPPSSANAPGLMATSRRRAPAARRSRCQWPRRLMPDGDTNVNVPNAQLALAGKDARQVLAPSTTPPRAPMPWRCANRLTGSAANDAMHRRPTCSNGSSAQAGANDSQCQRSRRRHASAGDGPASMVNGTGHQCHCGYRDHRRDWRQRQQRHHQTASRPR